MIKFNGVCKFISHRCRQCNVSLWVGSPLSISGMKQFGDWLTHYYYWFIHILIYMSMYMDVYGHTGHRSQSSIEHFMLYEQGPLIVNNDRTLCTGVTEVFPSEPSVREWSCQPSELLPLYRVLGPCLSQWEHWGRVVRDKECMWKVYGRNLYGDFVHTQVWLT